MLPDIQPGNTKILYFFNCLLDGMHTRFSKSILLTATKVTETMYRVFGGRILCQQMREQST